MFVKLIFDAQFVGNIEKIIEIPDNTTDEEIKRLFPKYLELEYDDNCSYEILPKKTEKKGSVRGEIYCNRCERKLDTDNYAVVNFLAHTKDEEYDSERVLCEQCREEYYAWFVKKPAIDRDTFIDMIAHLKSDIDFYNQISGICRKAGRQDSIEIYPKTMENFADLLQIALNDKNDYVYKWCYENDFGNREMVDKYGNQIKTTDELYDAIIKNE